MWDETHRAAAVARSARSPPSRAAAASAGSSGILNGTAARTCGSIFVSWAAGGTGRCWFATRARTGRRSRSRPARSRPRTCWRWRCGRPAASWRGSRLPPARDLPAGGGETRRAALRAYDPASGRALWSVPAGPKPHEFALSRDGRFAFVTNYGVDSFTETGPGANTITVIDLAQRERIGEIDLGDSRRPHGIEVAASGRLYVTADHPPRLLVIDPARRGSCAATSWASRCPHAGGDARRDQGLYRELGGGNRLGGGAGPRRDGAPPPNRPGIPQGFAWSEDGKRLSRATAAATRSS